MNYFDERMGGRSGVRSEDFLFLDDLSNSSPSGRVVTEISGALLVLTCCYWKKEN